MGHKKGLHVLTFILLVAGGLNWLLFGLFDMDVFSYFGESVGMVVYVLVGLSAVYEIFSHGRRCRDCSAPGAM